MLNYWCHLFICIGKQARTRTVFIICVFIVAQLSLLQKKKKLLFLYTFDVNGVTTVSGGRNSVVSRHNGRSLGHFIFPQFFATQQEGHGIFPELQTKKNGHIYIVNEWRIPPEKVFIS